MLALAIALLPLGDKTQAIDFDKVSRALSSEPTYVVEPHYGMFLFGPASDVRVWAVLDKSSKQAGAYDVLYLDRDADGVLGEEGERLTAKVEKGNALFEIGDFTQPGTDTVHTEFTLTWTEQSVRFRMLWRGQTLSMGGFGPYRETYASFGKSRKKATIYVPGYDRPLEFEHWMSDKMIAGERKSFKVFVGARGSRTGAFSCGDDKFLPKGEHVVATLIYTDEEGDQQRVRTKLAERC